MMKNILVLGNKQQKMVVSAAFVGGGVTFFSAYNDCDDPKMHPYMRRLCPINAVLVGSVGLMACFSVSFALAVIDNIAEKLFAEKDNLTDTDELIFEY